MPTYKNGKGYIINLATFDVELVAVDNSFNEVLVSWFTLDSDFAKNKVVALDPEYGMTIKFDSDSDAHKLIMDARYSVSGRSVDIIITDPLQAATTGSTITFSGVLASISEPRQTDDVVEVDITLKVESGDPVIAPVV